MSTQSTKSFLNKANTPQLKLKYQKIQKPLTKFYMNYLGIKADNKGSVICTLKSHRAPFLPLSEAECTLPLSASSMGLRYYITQMPENCPITQKAPGYLRHCTKVSLPPSDTQPSNTLGPALLQYLHKDLCPSPAAILSLFTLGVLLLTLYGSSICPLIWPMH